MSNAGKRTERSTPRTAALAAALAGLVAAAVVTTTAVAARPDPGSQVNPDLQASCGTDVIVILDESGSIDSSNAQGNVASALNAFVTGLQGTNSRMRIVEFSTNARDAQIGGSTAFRDVDTSFTTDVTTYLTPNLGVPPAGDNTQDPTSYRPWSTNLFSNQIYTNWEAALFEAADPGSAATGGIGAPLVVFLTDGNPNTVGTAGNSTGGNTNADTASDASIEEMAALQSAGAHVVSMAVGEAVTLPQPFGRLLNLTEPHVPAQVTWNGTGVLNLRTTDGIQVADFSAIDDALRSVVFALCAPSLTLHKSNQDGGDVAGWDFSTTVDSMSGGTSLDWVSPSDGAATAPTKKTRSTDSSGSTLFQWTPGSSANPELWSSTVFIEETLLPGWTVDPSTYAANNQNCTVGRLLDDGSVSNFTVDLSKTSPAGAPLPGETVRYDFVNSDGVAGPFALDKADIMTCDVSNQAPSTITIAKSATPLSTPDATPFAFTTTSGGALVPLPASFDLDDDGSDTPLPSAVTNTVSPGTFTITETSQDYWDLTAIECTDQTGQVTATPNLQTSSVEIVMPAGGAITCTFNNLQRPQPVLNVTKTASPLTFQEKDGTVTYTVLVNNPNGNANPVTITDISDSQQYNSGTAEVVDLSVADPPANGVGDVTSNDCNTLIGQSVGAADLTCSFTVAYTGTNAEDDFDDVVTVAGDDKYGFPVNDTGTAHVDVTPVPPQILVDKQNVQPVSVVAPGGPATYSVSVSNPAGAIETITLTAVTDQMVLDGDDFGAPLDITTLASPITATTCTNLVGQVLPPGDPAYTCQFTVDTTLVDPQTALVGGENLFNFVTVTAEDDDPTPQEVEGTDGAQRTIDAEPPAISVFKTDNGAEIVEPGSQITYDIEISNLGTAESLTIERIVDEIWFGPGLTPEGIVTIEDVPTGVPIEITTTLPGPQGATFVSTTCDALIGTMLDPATGVDAQGVPINADASASCEITLELPANAGDIYNDQVRVDATAPQGGMVNADNSASTPAIGQDPAVTIAKSPDYPTDDVTVPETGGDATFTFEITNSSAASTDPITLNTLTDSVFGDLFDPGNLGVTDISCVALQGTLLAQGASTSCQVSAFLSGTVSAPHSNTATITVTDDEGIEAMNSDDGAVGFTNVLPTITVLKTANPEIVSEYGANVTFSVVVTNTSAEPVTVTSLVDSVFGDLSVLSGSGCALGGTIAPNGGTYSCDFTQFVEQDQSVTPGATTHDDTVTAIAQDDEGFDATADDDATVTFITTPPTVGVTKTDDGVSVDEPGGTVTYTITVENTSPEPVTITTLTDTITYELPFNTIGPIDLFTPIAPITSSTCTVTDLAASDGAPGGADEMTCSFDVLLSGTSQVVSDVVNVTVTDNDGETGDADATDNTPINDVPPTVQVVKYANGEDVSTQIVPGEEVTYLFEIFNRSTVENILVQSLVDDVFGDLTAECGFDTLTWLTPDDGNDASGTDQTTCTIQRTPVTTPPDLPEYDHVNTVTVSAADDEIIRSQGGENPLPSVTDDDSVTVEMREPATIAVTKTASPPDTPFDFQLNGGNEQTTTPAAGVYPQLTWSDLDEGNYDLTETLPGGWELSDITCWTGAPPVEKAFGDITNGASLDVVWGENLTCQFDNTQLGDVSVAKTITAGPTQQAGSDLYDVTYEIVLTNESFREETFNATDTLGLAGDITVETLGTPTITQSIPTAPSAELNPSWNGEADTQLSLTATEPIAASTTSPADSTVTITIPVTYRVPGSTAPLDLACPTPGTGGAANNVAVAHSGTGDSPAEADACEPFAAPDTSYIKTISSPASLDPDTGIWSIAYDVVVTNLGDGADQYTLEDELEYGAGVLIDTVTTEVVSTSGQTDPTPPTTGDLSPTFDGVGDQVVIADVAIVAAAEHTYRISVTATIPVPIAGAGACDPDGSSAGGFLNVATIDGAISDQPSACEPFSTLKLVKIVNNQHGGPAGPDAFTLTGTNGETPPVIVTGDGTAIAAVPADDYTLSESSVAGYQQASLLCVGGALTDDSVNVAVGADVVCTFNNDDAPTGSVAVQKVAVPADEADFEFTLTGQTNQTTTAAGGYELLEWLPLSDGAYSLDEIVPADWELTNIECATSEGTFDGYVETSTGADFNLRWMEDVLCTFANTKLGDVSVAKSITSGPTQQAGTDLYDVAYEITATNTSFRDETINITDSLGITGDVTVDSIGTITTNPAFALDATWNGDTDTQLSDGDQIIAGSATAAGDSTVTITIPVTFRVPAGTSTAALTCQPGTPADDGGALNAVGLTSTTTGQDETNDEACNNFDEPSISWEKNVVDPGATYDAATGDWTIAYDVVVSNTGGGAGEYTLTDELRYGTGVVIGTVTATLDGSTDQTDPTAPGDGVINGGFDGVGDTTVVTGADIVSGATHTWRITVTATIPTATAGAGQCNPDGTTAGGFLNVSDISGATSDNGSACAPFSTLELVKIVDSGEGGNANPTDFTLTATGTDTPPTIVQGAGTVFEAVPADTFQLTETDVAGYSLVKIECDTVELLPDQDGNYFIAVGTGDDVKCEFTNDDGVVDLEIAKTDDDITAYEGGAPFDYTITVTNIGDRDVDAGEPVTVVDTLPPGLTWVSFPANCVQASQELTCDIDPTDLTADASVVITVTVEADAGTAPGTYTNGVYVTTQDDPVCTPIGDCTPPPCGETNNVACEDTPVIDRSIDVSGFTDVCVGEAPYIRYVILPIGFSPPPTQATLTIKDIDGNPIDYNGDGNVDDDDKVVVDTMTGNLLWPGAEVDSEGNAVDWPGWKFENGVWVEDPTDAIYRDGLLIDVEINPTATATVSYPPEASACADPTQVSADLQITKTTSATEVLPGQSFTWDMVVTNNGPDAATSLVITDQVPAPLVLTDVSSTDFTCSRSGNAMTCTKPTLAVGATGTIQITTTVPAGTQPVSSLTNIADITAVTPDPDTTNNSDSSATSIGCVNCLPSTGGDIGGLLRIAVGLLLGGLALLFVNRRRPRAVAADWPAPQAPS